MPPMPKVNFKGLADFLSKNRLAMVFMFVLLLAMIVMETSVTIFGFEFGFKNGVCAEAIVPSALPQVQEPTK